MSGQGLATDALRHRTTAWHDLYTALTEGLSAAARGATPLLAGLVPAWTRCSR